MDEKAKKTALRMITYGMYVLGAESGGTLGASTVTWVSQASFEPPLVMLGVKKTSHPFTLLSVSRRFALSFLESGQKDLAFTFFKPTEVALTPDGKRTIGGHPFEPASSGAPILTDALGWIEASVRSIDETGDHAVVIAEVTAAGIHRVGVPLTVRELGLHYGG